MNIEINNHEQSIAPLRNKFNELSNKVKQYEKYHFPSNPKRLAAELKKIKEKISFAAINVTEETELIKRKGILEDYEKDLLEFIKFKEENMESLNKSKKPKEERQQLRKKREELNKQIEELKSKKYVKKPEIERLNLIIDSLKKDKEEISKEIKALYTEWDNQWYEYNEQQKLIKYIKEANNKIKKLEKLEKQRKKENEEGESNNKDGTKKGTFLITTYKPDEKEIKLEKYNHLKNYFIALLPKEEQEKMTQEQKGNSNYDVSKDLKEGKLKKIVKEEDKDFAQAPGKRGKKGKKPKEAKDSRKGANKNKLTLDFDIIQSIKEAGLTPPLKVEDIPNFLQELEKNKTKVEKGETIERKLAPAPHK